jgi:hypothetical protein
MREMILPESAGIRMSRGINASVGCSWKSVMIFLKISFIVSSFHERMKIAYFDPFVKDKMCGGGQALLIVVVQAPPEVISPSRLEKELSDANINLSDTDEG